MSKWLLRCQRNDMKESGHNWVKRWINESMRQWSNESASQWVNESMKQRSNDPINRATSEAMNRWSNESVNEGMDEWMDGGASYFSLLSLFFTEEPLRWGTPSLSYFFSEPLICVACALSCLPASSLVASATQFFSSCGCSNAFGNLHPA